MRTIGRDFFRNIVSFAHRFPDNVNCLGRRIGIERVKENQSRIQVLSRANLNGFLRRSAVADQNNMVRESPNLDRAPGYFFNHARLSLNAHRDHIANLKWPISLQRDAGKEISQGVLKRKSQDDAEDR